MLTVVFMSRPVEEQALMAAYPQPHATLPSDFSVYDALQPRSWQCVSVVSRRTMANISAEIENATLLDGACTRIFAAFQQFSRYTKVDRRYQQLALNTHQLVVFGVPDVPPPDMDGCLAVCLTPDQALVQEWFLVSLGRGYASALAAKETTPPGTPSSQRMFKGLWTFDRKLVTFAAHLIHDTLGLAPVDSCEPPDTDERVYTMRRSVSRLLGQMENPPAPSA